MAPSCAGNCSFREVMSAIAMSCSEDSLSQHFSPSLGYYILSIFFQSSLSLEELGVGNTDIDVPGLNISQSLILRTLASCLSLN